MLDIRSPLIWGAPIAGLGVGALAWLVFGGSDVKTQLTGFEVRLSGLNVHAPRRVLAASDAASDALAHPIFSVGGAALSDAVVRLDGLAITPRRAAALVSINGQPSEWMERGATKDGITLQQVLPSKIVIDTATGPRDVGLQDKPQAPPTASPAPPGQPPNGDAPPGYRLPPPPASAPSPHR